MVSDIGRIVTGAAGPGNTGLVEQIIQPANSGDVDRNAVKDFLAAGDGLPRGDCTAALSVKIGPGIVNVEDHRIEGFAGRVRAKRIVDADKEAGEIRCQRYRATVSVVRSEVGGVVVVDLCSKDAGFEVDNLLLLRRSWVQCRLCMSARCIDRLLKQVRLTAIPHDRAQEA